MKAAAHLVILSLILAPAAARSEPAADLRDVRSQAAEALAVMRLKDQGRVTAVYAAVMLRGFAHDLDKAAAKAARDARPSAPVIDDASRAVEARDQGALSAALARLLLLEASNVQHP